MLLLIFFVKRDNVLKSKKKVKFNNICFVCICVKKIVFEYMLYFFIIFDLNVDC